MLNGEETLLHPHLANSATGRTGGRIFPFLGTTAIALVAGNLCRHIDGDGIAGDRAFKIEFQLITELRASEHLA